MQKLQSYEENLNLFHNATKLPFCVFNNAAKDLFRCPLIETMNCSTQTLQQCCDALADKDVHIPVLLSFHTCFYALIRLDEEINIMFGPISSAPLSYRTFYRLSESFRDTNDLLHLYRIMQQSPLMPLSIFVNNICLFLKLCFQETISAQDILANEITHSYRTETTYPVYYSDHSFEKMTQPIVFQKKILFYLQNGNLEGLQRVLDHAAFFEQLRTTPFSVDDFQKIFFSYATICCTAILEKGVSADHALPVLDSYVSRTPSIKTATDLILLCQQSSIDFCMLVEPLQHASSSTIVNKSLHYILSHLHSTITVEDLAKHCNTSSRTITRHFAEFYHQSASECIMHEKLKEAAFLLTHSNMTLSEISNQLAFSSQSHLTVAFKKKYLTTPQQYRTATKSFLP